MRRRAASGEQSRTRPISDGVSPSQEASIRTSRCSEFRGKTLKELLTTAQSPLAVGEKVPSRHVEPKQTRVTLRHLVESAP
jgi:hypothetical protein